ncbi:cupin domain-containing protein [Fontimonas sp. SYSU GA230001]|uniref:cupin domain-containing protein n=1 Tax=Fontimonas sp. SYSU GA230001 TaxID=3142450 RepID=UPI0032B38F85
MTDAVDWIKRLDLAPHPEGGHFRRIYTDERAYPTLSGNRPLVTSIHYLLSRKSPVGYLHRNRSTVLHYLQDGGPVEYLLLPESGVCQRVVLGGGEGEQIFLQVPGGCWKACHLQDGVDHALISEVVVPGFDGIDHQFMPMSTLRRDFAALAGDLLPFLRPPG